MTNAMPTHFGEEIIDERPRNANGRLVGEETLLVKFYKKPFYSSMKSEEQQRPVYDDLDFIEIRSPGDKTVVIDTLVDRTHIDRFPQEYQRYIQSGASSATSGTPLEDWPFLTAAHRKEFKYFDITTIEAVSMMSDSVAQRFSGGVGIREKARQYLALMNDQALVSKQQAEIEKQEQKFAAQAAEMAEMRQMIADLQKSKKAAPAA